MNLTTGDLDALRRLAEAQRELGEVAHALHTRRTSQIQARRGFARRLNVVKASLHELEESLGGGG